MENKCSSQEECTGSSEHKCCQQGECPDKKGSCCPVDHAMDMWMCASHKAWQEVHVDILKTKILKAWGPQMEKTADAIIEAMGIEWKAMMTQSKAKVDLKTTIASILRENSK